MARARFAALTCGFCLAVVVAAPAQVAEPLPSWNDGRARQSIIDFVAKVTKDGSPDFVAPPARVAVFDNDGTLWAEQPMYVQVFFLIGRIKALAPEHPEWKSKEPFASLLAGDLKAVAATGESGLAELVAATHSGVTTDEFSKTTP